MNVRPVITRELRAQARQPFTFTLRVVGVGAMLAAAGWGIAQQGDASEFGAELFRLLHLTLFLAIWVLVPLGASDCLSRERREGTLGLLLLTPLSVRDIVIAKCFAHGSRAFTLWLASLPVLVLPFLIGGINWKIVGFSCVVNLCSLLLAVGASVVASAYCRQAHRALALTAAIEALLLPMLAYIVGAVMWLVFHQKNLSYVAVPGAVNVFQPFYGFSWDNWLGELRNPWYCAGGFWLAGFAPETLSSMWFGRGGGLRVIHDAGLISLTTGGVLTFLLVIGMVWLATRIIRRHWREAVRSPRAEQLEKQFCRPVFGGSFLRTWLRRSLEHNPIGWLGRRSWSGRLVGWAWLALIVCVYAYTFTAMTFFMTEFNNLQFALAVLLLLSLTATAAGSFRSERETGVLELLLVTPLSERQIIAGRLRGIWGQFLPSVVLMAGIWIFAAGIFNANPSYRVELTNGWNALWMLSSLVALPIIGLRNSLAFSSYIGAFVATLVLGQFVPVLAMKLPQIWRAVELLTGLRSTPNWPEANPVGLICGALVQLLIAIALLLSLHRNLVQRRFARERRLA